MWPARRRPRRAGRPRSPMHVARVGDVLTAWSWFGYRRRHALIRPGSVVFGCRDPHQIPEETKVSGRRRKAGAGGHWLEELRKSLIFALASDLLLGNLPDSDE